MNFAWHQSFHKDFELTNETVSNFGHLIFVISDMVLAVKHFKKANVQSGNQIDRDSFLLVKNCATHRLCLI